MTDVDEPSITVKLSTIYDIVMSLKDLPRIVDDHIKRTDQSNLEQNVRIGDLELRVTTLEATHAVETRADEKQRKVVNDAKSGRPNLTAIGALIVSGVVAAITFIKEIAN